jgi:cell division protein FtsL
LSAGEELAREALRASMALNGDPVAARREERKRAMSDGKVKFDPTINLGHILTFAAMAVAVMSSYSLLDKRVGVLEERSSTALSQAAEKVSEQKESLKEIKSDVKDLQRSVNEISRVLAGRGPRP